MGKSINFLIAIIEFILSAKNNSSTISTIPINMSEYLGSITTADDDRQIGTEPRIVSVEESSMNEIIQLIQKEREEDQLERFRTQTDIADLKSALSSL